jgi:hypothetical protein
MTRKISQREARRLRRRVEELERNNIRRLSLWHSEYPGGVNVANLDTGDWGKELRAKLLTTRMLGFAIVAKMDGPRVMFYGVTP